jgi:alpha-glucoside transport system permease protein
MNESGSFFSQNFPKFASMFESIAIFAAVLLAIFWIANRVKGKAQRPLATVIFLGPALVLLTVGLIAPTIQTLVFSFKDPNSKGWVGFSNYTWIFTDPSMHTVLLNTLFWIAITPITTTLLGLVLAMFLDRLKRESIPKSLIFMPMAISFVGASIIWQFIYNYAAPNYPQTGLLSAIAKKLGFVPPDWMLQSPLNTFLLMIIFIWVETGFAMVILSAAIKAIPADIVEASALDGASGFQLFRGITFPMVRSTFIVVLATMVVTSLKLFDIVRTVTGGNFNTSVLSNEMYSEVFVRFDQGKGSAMAIVLFIFVIPILLFNIWNLRKERTIA